MKHKHQFIEILKLAKEHGLPDSILSDEHSDVFPFLTELINMECIDIDGHGSNVNQFGNPYEVILNPRINLKGSELLTKLLNAEKRKSIFYKFLWVVITATVGIAITALISLAKSQIHKP